MPDRRDISEAEHRRVRQIKRAAIVMAATMVLWIAAQYIGAQMGWPPRFAFLIDLAAFAALVWALIVTYWVWKERKRDPDHR
ncbi:DUF5337 domain-containing protein [Gymnodinialimonas ceratoperidinii]|uniref:DUF5337 domain-containing protein n=1 Tax=Gymnodinialimonas ceratoperidinii TaxID=2856823 RepID=A0A8F6TWF7_9RHOB|nr:DUF5337 domain-containing protein [Gymnodinialimonas ceratoperidinii]QXT39183.1 DUF5337 domain-containing protein [Gymnodinialimonas ceratoperidinii]